MARREKIIIIKDREQELTFKIREMPATHLESWIIRSVILLAGAGADVPLGRDIHASVAYLAERGLASLGNIDFEKAKPLLDELLGCCSRLVENIEEKCTPASVDSYVEDISTLLQLRMEAIKLNLGFFKPGTGNPSGSREKPDTSGQAQEASSPNTPT